MDTVAFNRIAFPTLALAFFGLLLVFPTIRLRRRTGTWPMVLRSRSAPVQVVIGWLFALMVAAFCLWAGLYSWLGPEVLGVWPTPRVLHLLGWTFIASAFLLGMAGQAQMGASWRMGIDPNRTELVVEGLFRFSRNPIYSSIILGLLGIVLASSSPWTILGWVVTAATLDLQARFEEQHMLALHGEHYLQYASRVGRPRCGMRLRPPRTARPRPAPRR